MSVNCVYCGHVNPDGSTVCLSCGRTLPPAPSGGPSYGQQAQQPQQPPQSWGAPPPPQPQAPSSYPPANPYGGSYPPQDPSSWQGGYGGQPSAPPPQQQTPPPSYGSQPGYGGQGYQPQQQPQQPSYGQAPNAWGVEPQPYAMANPEAQSAKQMATIALVVGVVGLLIGWCCWTGIVLGPTAAILGFVARGKLARNGAQDGQGIAMAAIILGALVFIIPLVLGIIQLLLGAAGGAFR